MMALPFQCVHVNFRVHIFILVHVIKPLFLFNVVTNFCKSLTAQLFIFTVLQPNQISRKHDILSSAKFLKFNTNNLLASAYQLSKYMSLRNFQSPLTVFVITISVCLALVRRQHHPAFQPRQGKYSLLYR